MDHNWSASNCFSPLVSSSECDDVSDTPQRDPWDTHLADLRGSCLLQKTREQRDVQDNVEAQCLLTETDDLRLIKSETTPVRLRTLKSIIKHAFLAKSNHYLDAIVDSALPPERIKLKCDLHERLFRQLDNCDINYTTHDISSELNLFPDVFTKPLNYSGAPSNYERLTCDRDNVYNNCVTADITLNSDDVSDKSDIDYDHGFRADNSGLFSITKNRMTCPIGPNSRGTVLEISKQVQLVAQYMGQAFSAAYTEFLKVNGIEDPPLFKQLDYQEVLSQQQTHGDELLVFSTKEMCKELVIQKPLNEALGVVIVESGWGSLVPTVVVAKMSPTGAAARSKQLNIGDNIMAINGRSLVGLPLPTCQRLIKKLRQKTVVTLSVVSCPPVIEVCIRRPDIKYQFGFSLHNGVVCSLVRGGIGERGGVRVGHRIIEVNNQSVVAVPHDKIVGMLASSVGDIWMKTISCAIFGLMTGQEVPRYI